jgi:hypothetical protein
MMVSKIPRHPGAVQIGDIRDIDAVEHGFARHFVFETTLMTRLVRAPALERHTFVSIPLMRGKDRQQIRQLFDVLGSKSIVSETGIARELQKSSMLITTPVSYADFLAPSLPDARALAY